MSRDNWVGYWEDALKRAEKNLESIPQTYKEIEYWRGVVPYKHILRSVRLRADLPICWGAADCVENPTKQCVEKKHDTCGEHQATCFLCKAEASKPEKVPA